MYNVFETDFYQAAQKSALDFTNAMLDIQNQAISAALTQAEVNLSTQRKLTKAWIDAVTVEAPKND